jgi:hypothetical protein
MERCRGNGRRRPDFSWAGICRYREVLQAGLYRKPHQPKSRLFPSYQHHLPVMAGGHMKYRHLSRSSSHRQALLRNLVTSLFKHETIATTWHKAKEAQRLAEQLVTLGKKNTEATRRRATQIFFVRLTFTGAPNAC